MKTKESKDSILSMLKSQYIRKLVLKYKLNYIIGIVFLVLIDFLQTKVPIIIGNVIDNYKANNLAISVINGKIMKIALLAIFIVIGRIAWRYFIFGVARLIERDIRNDLFSHLQKLSQRYFNKHKTGEIMAYITNDLEAVRMAMGQGMMMLFDVIALCIFTIFNMVTKIDIGLTVVSVIPLLLIALTTGLLGPKMFKGFFERQESFAKMSDFVQENLSGIKVIKAFVQQKQEIEAFKDVNKDYFNKNMKLAKIQAAMHPIMSFISGLSLAIAIGFGGVLAAKTTISVGDFAAFIQFLGMLVWPMMAIGMCINMITTGSAAMKRIESVLNQEIEIQDAEIRPESEQEVQTENEQVVNNEQDIHNEQDANNNEQLADDDLQANDEEDEKIYLEQVDTYDGSIEMKNLNFAYPDTDDYVLKDISFKVNKGETLGIVGRTGSGKSTLVNLLVRLYNVDKGTIFIGGYDILSLPLHTLRKNIGFVPQENFLFSESIERNIDFSDGNLGKDKVVEAAEFACVHDNIIDFKEGYDTIVGERGVTLSGGQKQRVSIARALIKDPEILILDDSVSAVDTDTEEKILANLKKQRNGKTNIIIADRISTIQHADNIIVIDEGRIVEEGNHQQLVELGGIYNSLYQKQLLEKMIDDEA